ncbi:hypothetical protein NMG60_11003643 [Bertholletia excelsa]
MMFAPHFLRPTSQFISKASKSRSQIAIADEVLGIVNSVSHMEAALETLVPSLSSEIVNFVLQEQRNSELAFRFFIWVARRREFRCWISYDYVIDLIVRDNGFEMYWRTLEKLRSCGVPISADAFTVLISGYFKAHMPDEAVEAFGRMKDFNCKPDLHTYNVILHVMVRREVILLALAVYNMMLKSNCAPNCATFTMLIDGLCKSGNTEDALKLFDEMIARGTQPNRITYTVIILGLCKAKRTDEAYRLFNSMRSIRCSPDLVAYNALLSGLCKLGKIDEAFTLSKSLKEDGFVLGLKAYSCLIDGLFRARKYTEAHEFFQKLFQENIAPDLILYTIMIKGLSRAGKIRDAWKLFRVMGERGVVPDTQCYNTLIKGFCDMGLLDDARCLQLEISNYDCFPDTNTYTILICGMCRKGLVGEAKEIFKEMEKVGCFPSVVTFNALIDGLCKDGKLEEARLLFYEMEIGKNPSLFLRLSQGRDKVLDRASLQSMVEKLCDSGLINKAYRLLMQLANSGVLPDIRTYNILMNGFCKAGNVNVAFKLLKELQLKGLSPDPVTYGTLIDGLQRADMEDDAFRIFEQMTKNGFTPGPAVYKSLMCWSCRKKKIFVAFGLWMKYLRSLPSRESEAIKLAEEQLEKGELERAVRGLLEMEFNLMDFDSKPYTIWLIGLCQAGMLDEALKVFSILEGRIIISSPSCVMLINHLRCEQNLDQAIDIFSYTMEKGFILNRRICNKLLNHLLFSKEKAYCALDLVNRMKYVGYNLGKHLFARTKFRLKQYRDALEAENVSHG